MAVSEIIHRTGKLVPIINDFLYAKVMKIAAIILVCWSLVQAQGIIERHFLYRQYTVKRECLSAINVCLRDTD